MRLPRGTLVAARYRSNSSSWAVVTGTDGRAPLGRKWIRAAGKWGDIRPLTLTDRRPTHRRPSPTPAELDRLDGLDAEAKAEVARQLRAAARFAKLDRVRCVVRGRTGTYFNAQANGWGVVLWDGKHGEPGWVSRWVDHLDLVRIG